jgi:hypothetical protein
MIDRPKMLREMEMCCDEPGKSRLELYVERHAFMKSVTDTSRHRDLTQIPTDRNHQLKDDVHT